MKEELKSKARIEGIMKEFVEKFVECEPISRRRSVNAEKVYLWLRQSLTQIYQEARIERWIESDESWQRGYEQGVKEERENVLRKIDRMIGNDFKSDLKEKLELK